MGPRIQRWDPEAGQLGPARKDFLGPRRCLEIERLFEPGLSLSRQQEKRRRGGSFTPCSPAASASSPLYAAMGGEPPPLDVTLVTRAFSLRALTGHDVPPQTVRCGKSPARRVQRRAGGAYIVPPR
jgi:hypothetical protein